MTPQRIIVGSDHAGFSLKEELRGALTGWGWEVEDAGCHSRDSVDYPDLALEVARRVSLGDPSLGLLVCGTGIGVCIAANKVEGIRAALCHETFSASASRAHNDANILCLGGRVIGPDLARVVLESFIKTPFEGGRHQRRLDKISAAE